MMEDLTGRQFGRLTAICIKERNPKSGRMWLCKCECGNETVARETDIRLWVPKKRKKRDPWGQKYSAIQHLEGDAEAVREHNCGKLQELWRKRDPGLRSMGQRFYCFS